MYTFEIVGPYGNPNDDSDIGIDDDGDQNYNPGSTITTALPGA
jgi:hypothetical protein